VIRPSGLIPWKPATTATFMPSANFWRMLPVGISSIRAAAWAELVRSGTCQPCQERAGMSISCSVSAMSPAVTFSPLDTTASYSRASKKGEVSSTWATSRFVSPAMADTTTITSWPFATSRPTRLPRRIRRADARIDMRGDRGEVPRPKGRAGAVLHHDRIAGAAVMPTQMSSHPFDGRVSVMSASRLPLSSSSKYQFSAPVFTRSTLSHWLTTLSTSRKGSIPDSSIEKSGGRPIPCSSPD
jgi:hypothetical protein